MAVGALTAETLESSQRNTLSAKSFYFDAITVGVRIEITLWQARSFGAKRQQAETLTSPRLLLDGAFPIPPVTQISSVAARCAIAIFPRAAARWSAGSVRSAPADRRRSPCGSAAPAFAPAHGGTRRRPPPSSVSSEKSGRKNAANAFTAASASSAVGPICSLPSSASGAASCGASRASSKLSSYSPHPSQQSQWMCTSP